MARPRTDQLKQGLLLAFVAAGIVLAALNWAEQVSGSNGGTKNFYRPTYIAPTVIVSATVQAAATAQATASIQAAATGAASATPGAPTPPAPTARPPATGTPTPGPNVDDNG
jgi:hypothetical protein